MQEMWVQSLGWEDPLEYPFQYSFLENSIDRKVWCTAVCGVTKSWTWLSAHIHTIKVKVKSLSHVWLFATPWNVAHQAPLSIGLSRQEYWSGLPFPPPGIKSASPAAPALAAKFFNTEPPGKPKKRLLVTKIFWWPNYCKGFLYVLSRTSLTSMRGC